MNLAAHLAAALLYTIFTSVALWLRADPKAGHKRDLLVIAGLFLVLALSRFTNALQDTYGQSWFTFSGDAATILAVGYMVIVHIPLMLKHWRQTLEWSECIHRKEAEKDVDKQMLAMLTDALLKETKAVQEGENAR